VKEPTPPPQITVTETNSRSKRTLLIAAGLTFLAVVLLIVLALR
jgi:hypothetical protein